MAVGSLQPSGRVIASGRLLLAFLFLVAGWADSRQSALGMSLPLLAFYFTWALGLTLLVWNGWWLDARLAAPAHVIDVAAFMIMLYSTEGYTSPYFIFFIFFLLSAAIRWGWRETAVTAAAMPCAPPRCTSTRPDGPVPTPRASWRATSRPSARSTGAPRGSAPTAS